MKKILLISILGICSKMMAAPPDCVASFVYTNRAPTVDNRTTFLPNTQGLIYNNGPTGCNGWVVNYSSEGFSSVNLTIQSGAASSRNTTPGTLSPFGGTVVLGVNPMTTTNGTFAGIGYFPWFSTFLNAVGTGTVHVYIYGWTSTTYITGVGGGGGGGITGITINNTTGVSFTFPLQGTSGPGILVNYDTPSNTNIPFLDWEGRAVTSGTTDIITQSDCDRAVDYKVTGTMVTSLAQAGLNVTQGCNFVVTNRSTGTTKIDLSATSTFINGASSITLSAATDTNPTWVWFRADATGNYTILGINNTGTPIKPIGIAFDGGGSALVSGKVGYYTVPFGCTLKSWDLTADTGTFTAKIWKIASGTAIPTSSNSISTSGISLSTGTSVHSTTLTDFTTTTFTAYDRVGFNLSAVSGATLVSIVLGCQ